MQTVVLAAGRGTRMGPLTDRRPKPTLPVAARPLVGHVMDAAAAAGASRFVVVVGYEDQAVREVVGEEWAGVPVEYAVQDDPRGTADAVLTARPHLDRGPFVVLNADTLYGNGALSAVYEDGPAVTAARVENPGEYGVLLTADGGQVATDIVEKPSDPPTNLVNAGAYRFPAVALDWLDVEHSPRGERELTDVLSRVCEAETVRVVETDRWLDVGRPPDLLAANEWKLAETTDGPVVHGQVSDDARLSGAVVVEAGAQVRSGVVVEGPALVRSGATVGPNAYVRGATYLGPEVHVGHAVEVKNSVLMRGTSVGHLSYVGDSILGRDVNFGAGTVTANLRHDDRQVTVAVNGDRVSTGRRKFGAVVGDGAKTGINTSIDAGVTLSTGARTGVGESVTRDR